MDTRITEMMFRLMSDATRGVAGAQQALKSLSELPARPDALMSWLRENLPAAADLSQSRVFGEQLEQWFKLMGFVPRKRHLELLERYEDLRLKLEEAEAMKNDLQKAIGPQHAAAKLLETFGDTVSRTLDAQREWLNLFTGAGTDSGSDSQVVGGRRPGGV
jgi:predicted DNA-binding protein (UPF0251 family)